MTVATVNIVNEFECLVEYTLISRDRFEWLWSVRLWDDNEVWSGVNVGRGL